MDITRDLQLSRQERRLTTAALDPQDGWVSAASLLWKERLRLLRVAVVAFIVSTAVAFLLPKQYESTARIMPPDQQNGGAAALLAAVSGKAMPGGMGALAGSLFGMKNTGALYVDLLHSRSVEEHLVEQFDLQKVYQTRYRQDAMKGLFYRTDITEDHKSGVITIAVTDKDRRRARDLTQAYLDQLDSLLARVNTSAARRERQFIEQRLVTVKSDLERAELELSDFSSKNATLDIGKQAQAMVEAGAKLQGELIVGRSELDSLEQIYGSENVRVRAARARVADLQRELQRMIGSSESAGKQEKQDSDLYPPLRQLPVLGVRWADLYRRVKIEETVYDLLNGEYETARIEEAKSIPTVSVIDSPNWPEKKSSPPRRLIVIGFTLLSLFFSSFRLLMRKRWQTMERNDPRKQLGRTIWLDVRHDWLRFYRRNPTVK